MRLNHLHLHVADVAVSRAYYERWFGFTEDTWHGDILFLRDDAGFQLALAPRPVEPMPSWWHFGFRLPTPGAVRELHAALASAGQPIVAAELDAEDGAPDDGLVYFRATDPDGYLIEVYFE